LLADIVDHCNHKISNLKFVAWQLFGGQVCRAAVCACGLEVA
jgi:hypothetical protein